MKKTFLTRFLLTATLFVAGCVCLALLAGEPDADAGTETMLAVIIEKAAAVLGFAALYAAAKKLARSGWLLNPSE